MQSLRTPVTSCENLAATFSEAYYYPKHNSSNHNNSRFNNGNGNGNHHLGVGGDPSSQSSSPQSVLCCCCCCCSHFCRSHISILICLGLIFLFIFNMTLYSFIFYQAHIEGHGF